MLTANSERLADEFGGVWIPLNSFLRVRGRLDSPVVASQFLREQYTRWEPSVQATAGRPFGTLAPPADRNPAAAPVDHVEEPPRVRLGQRLGSGFADPGIGPAPEEVVRDRLAEMGISEVRRGKARIDADGKERRDVDVPIDWGCEEFGAGKSNVSGPDAAAGAARGVRLAQVLQLAVTDDFGGAGPARGPERIADEQVLLRDLVEG
jgi:hypothetical protein